MKRLLFTLGALLFFAIASAQTDSTRTGKTKISKTEKSAKKNKVTKKTDDRPINSPDNAAGRRKQNNSTTQPGNSTDPNYRGTEPKRMPSVPDGTAPTNGTVTPSTPTSPVVPGQP